MFGLEELGAVVMGLGTLGLAMVVLIALNRLLGAVDGATFIGTMIVPLLVWALASGRLEEFSGPGGWGAKFREEARSLVEAGDLLTDVDELQLVEKGSSRNLQRAVARLDPKVPNALTLRVGRSGYYAADAILEYLSAMTTLGPSTYVVFVDHRSDGFVGSASAAQVRTSPARRADTKQGHGLAGTRRGWKPWFRFSDQTKLAPWRYQSNGLGCVSFNECPRLGRGGRRRRNTGRDRRSRAAHHHARRQAGTRSVSDLQTQTSVSDQQT